MPRGGEPPLLDRYLSDYDVTEFHARVVNAEADTTWEAIRHGDLADMPLVRALLALRDAPGRLRARVGRREAPPRPPFTFDDMAGVGFELLDERPGEIVFGFVGKPWRVGAEQPLAVGSGSFTAFGDPGYAKVAFSIRIEPHGDHRTLVTTETRVATTDARSRRRFATYWKLIGPFSALIRRAILKRVTSDAEAAPSRRESGIVRIDGEIVINRPVEEVFDFVADERNEPRYNPRMRRAEKISPGPIGLGTRFRAEVTTMRRPAEMTIENTAYDRPRRLASTTRLATMDIRGSLTFDPVAEGTRMRWRWDLKPRGVAKLMSPMVARMGERQEHAIWGNLKRLLEGQDRHPGEVSS